MIAKVFNKHRHSTVSGNQAIREGLSSLRKTQPILARATLHDYVMHNLLHGDSRAFPAKNSAEASKPGINEGKRCDNDTVVEMVYA